MEYSSNRSRKNWAGEYENKEEERTERNLNNRVSRLIEEIDNLTDTKDNKILNNLSNEGLNYDVQVKKYVKEKLSELQYKELEDKHKQEGGDHDSWREFQEEKEEKEEEELEK